MTPSEFLALDVDLRVLHSKRVRRWPTMAKVWEKCEDAPFMFTMLDAVRPLTQVQGVTLALAFVERMLPHVPVELPLPHKAAALARTWLDNPTDDLRPDAKELAFATGRETKNPAIKGFVSAHWATRGLALSILGPGMSRVQIEGTLAHAWAQTCKGPDDNYFYAGKEICPIIRSIIPQPL